MNAKFEIRAGVPVDLPSIWAIEASNQNKTWTQAQFRDALEPSANRLALVALESLQKTAIGFIFAHFAADEIEILNIAVHPSARRRGVANLLCQELFAAGERRACRQIFLEVRQSNSGARAFYENAGFKISGVRKNYYRDNGEDALLMMRRLDNLSKGESWTGLKEQRKG